ncbi:MAG TPA: zinc-binding dehydrogenase [Acidimicrobiia bacterium]
MRAWLLDATDGPGSFRLSDVDVPETGPGKVRVGLRAIGLNHLDIWVSQGRPAPKSFPHIAGADGAGVVEEVGEGVAGWTVGDEVIIDPTVSCGECEPCLRGDNVFCKQFSILGETVDGTLAESVVVGANQLRLKPRELGWVEAGTFGLVTGTAYRMLARARLRAGESVLVVGVGGGVASTAALMARAMDARVLVTSRSADKVGWALDHGAEAAFDSATEFSKDVKNHLGSGVDVVVENVGPATWNQSVRSLAPGGRMVVCGGTSGTEVPLHLPTLFYKQLEIIGSTMATRAEFARALELVSTGKLAVAIDRVYPFEELPAAMARLDAGEQIGKLALTLGG